MNRLWTCMKCSQDAPPGDEIAAHKGFSFVAPKPEGRYAPVCPQCGLDGGEPDLRDWIAPLVVNHFEAPHPAGIPGKGCGKMACTGQPRAGKVQVTGDPRMVTCPACQATAAYKANKGDFDNPAEYVILTPAAPSEG